MNDLMLRYKLKLLLVSAHYSTAMVLVVCGPGLFSFFFFLFSFCCLGHRLEEFIALIHQVFCDFMVWITEVFLSIIENINWTTIYILPAVTVCLCSKESLFGMKCDRH